MRQTALFTKILKETPKDEVSKNSQLLLRAGFIHKDMAGVYSFLPLGLRVLKKIETIIREEMNGLGAQEIVLASLQNQETWEPTNQWDDSEVDVWFKTKLKNNTELGLAFTHEAPITKMLRSYCTSYRDLPKFIYQFQTKFRNEVRAKSGIMRTREFLMKDMYSFSRTEEEHATLYEQAKQAYLKIFRRLGLGDLTYLTFASGGMFSKFSHEFQAVTPAGEDTIYLSEKKKIAVNKEIYSSALLEELGLTAEELQETTASEVGNIFNLGTRFSNPLGLQYTDERGNKHDVIMGSYGIGPARVMGTVVETLATDNGLVWPEAIAPFQVHIVALGESDEVSTTAEAMYETLTNDHIEVLYDDRREVSNGEKLVEADMIGCTFRIVVSQKSLAEGGVEIKKRDEGDGQIIAIENIKKFLHSK